MVTGAERPRCTLPGSDGLEGLEEEFSDGKVSINTLYRDEEIAY